MSRNKISSGRARRILAGLAVVAGVSLAGSAAHAEMRTFAPSDAGFSVLFPGTPQMERRQEPQADTWLWSARREKFLCVVGLTDYAGHIEEPQAELDLDMNNFLKKTQGSLQTQKDLSFVDAPDGPLPARDFTFSTPTTDGESLIIISGDRAYQLVVVFAKGEDGAGDAARILQSFKITLPRKVWQGK
jgi:hypothetical protein